MENVPAITSTGWRFVAGEMTASGYDPTWGCLSSEEFGAPIRRESFVAVAFANRLGLVSHEIFDRDASESTTQEAREKEWDGALGRSDCQRLRWIPPPRVRRVRRMVDGVPTALDAARMHAIGNAVSPVVARWLGRRVRERHELENDCKLSP